MEKKQKTYCHIVSCVNNLGTKTEQMFMLPSNENQRAKWVQVIEKYQKISQQKFSVCIRHFQDKDLKQRGKNKMLISGAIPSIFPRNQNSEELSNQTKAVDTTIGNDTILRSNVESLKKEILIINMDNDIRNQKLEQKILSLESDKKNMSENLKKIRVQLKQEESKNAKLKKEISVLKKNQYISSDDAKFSNVSEIQEILQCLCQGIKEKESYPQYMRAFSMCLHYISPRAYKFVRDKFGNNMPHPQTIIKWYRNSDLDAIPGTVGAKALEAIELKAKLMEEQGEQLLISLVFDEMAVQRNLMWCRNTNKFIGLIDYGKQDENEDFTLANNVIVFMACGINAYFEQPIAFFFIRTLNASERADLIKKVMTDISKHNIKIANITFDGYSPNGSMCESLGANFKGPDYQTDLVNPHDGSIVRIMYDPSHLIKMVRNTLGTHKVLYTGDDEISWQYIEELVKYSKQNNFGLTHKMNKRHTEFADRKMHVRTAVETLSSSTADSLEFLRARGVPEFVNSGPLIKFIRIFDKLWDVMNSQCIRNDCLTIFKSAMNPENFAEIYEFLMEAKDYIHSLQIRNNRSGKKVSILSSKCKTGFRGFVIDIISIINMYREFIEKHNWLNFLATYRMSQDHLEMFFGKIRSMNGYNENPMALQFVSAYRKLLHQSDVIISEQSNVNSLCTSNVLTVSSKRGPSLQQNVNDHFEDENQLQAVGAAMDTDYTLQEWCESLELELLENNEWTDDTSHADYIQNSGIAYAANLLERRLTTSNRIYCGFCKDVLMKNEKVDDEICTNFRNSKPCLSTFQLCKSADAAIRMHINTGSDLKDRVQRVVLNNIPWENIFPEFFEPEHNAEHKDFLVKFIIDEYVNKKCAYIAKQKTIELQKKYIRNNLRKLGHRMHQ